MDLTLYFPQLGLPGSESQTSLTSNDSKTTTGTEDGSTPKLNITDKPPGMCNFVILHRFLVAATLPQFPSNSELKYENVITRAGYGNELKFALRFSFSPCFRVYFCASH